MSADDRAPMGIQHLTVVPENFDPEMPRPTGPSMPASGADDTRE